MWDVIVVGARCAGATTALRFARAGRSVLMLDKSRLGSDTLSTHVLVSGAMATLEKLALLDAVLATGAPRVHKNLVEFEGKAYPADFEPPLGYILCVRRSSLDPILVDAAQKAGVTVQHEVQVKQLLWDGDRVVGVQVRDASGNIREERARLVIGADGRHSLVAQMVKAVEYNEVNCPSGVAYAYFRGIGETSFGADVLHFAAGPESDVLCTPCDGGVHVILLNVSTEEFSRIKPQGAEAYEARLRTISAFQPRFANAERVGNWYPADPRELRGYFRQPYGKGWVLVGDAGYYAHPASARGISDAFRSGELAYELVERAWSQEQPAETYLEEYQRTRDTENTGAFYFSYRLGKVNALLRDPEVKAAFTGEQPGEQ